ncbi:hypothetical protein ABT369_06940 [Dactylosporangium sp. NPDC000244]|uniref:hypothetical protein n=1 Tax=Dactylosporangium sp. NPDC000244 TaxID=3154365 RepID=UPI00331C65CC
MPHAAGRTRYALRYGPLEPRRLLLSLHGLRELWDERDTAGLLARCGGSRRACATCAASSTTGRSSARPTA